VKANIFIETFRRDRAGVLQGVLIVKNFTFLKTTRQGQSNVFSCSGFTLLEIIVTLAIFSILVAIAVPIWSTLVPGYRLNSAARQVTTEFQSARNRAMAQYRRFRVVFDSATTYKVERENTPGAADYVLFSGPKNLPPAITAAANNTPVFQSRGDASPAANVTLTNTKGETKVIAVSSVGRVEIQ